MPLQLSDPCRNPSRSGVECLGGNGAIHRSEGYGKAGRNAGRARQGMTTNQKGEQIRVLRMLLASDPGDHQPHESYAANNPKHFTRKDFGWAKAQFAEFVLRSILGRRPLPVPPKPERDTYVNNLPS